MLKLENMKNKNLILSVLLLIICKFGFSQMVRLESVSYSYVQVVNNEVLLNYGAPTTMRVSVMLSKPVQNPWGSLPVKGEVKLFYYKNNQEVNILDPITFSSADWSLPTFSNFIVKDFTIPANTVTTTNPKIEVLAKWRYYKEGYPHPDNNNGWTDWYNGGSTNFVLNNSTLPEATFTGPSQICNEGTFSVTNPGTITLENASGIATLSSLGNNQWKITRIGTANGLVKLRSTSNGKTFDKDIEIGIVAKGSISGNAVLQLGESQTYTLALNGNTDYNWSVTYNPNVTWTKLSATSIKLSTTGSVPMGWSENITISAQAVGSCGTSSNYILKTIKFVNERDPRLD